MRIVACFASSLDGKIASGVDPHSRIGSQADLEHLRNVRDQGDAVLCGGETFREYPYVRRGNRQKTMLQCILTRRFDLPPDAPLFKADPPAPVLIFSPEPAPASVREQYPPHVEWMSLGSANPIPGILKALEARDVQTLLVEGGGHIMQMFLKEKAVQELYLTVCPLFLGSEGAAGLVTGPGFSVAEAPRTEILSLEKVENELYLRLKIHYPQVPGYSA